MSETVGHVMRVSPRLALWYLILGSGLLRLLWCASLEPSNDEAYHWLYTRHPALSYFDHPPMTMLVAKLGLLLCGGWVHPLSLRLGFALLFAGSTWVLFRWTADLFTERAGFWAAVLLNLSGYFTAFGGTFALPDSPFLFFALVTFWRSSLAAKSKRIADWFWVGLGFAGAMLSKYHAVLLPAGVVLFAIITRPRRKLLWSPGPYLAVVQGLLGFLPVFLWNQQHDWASFRFQGGRASSSGVIPFLHEGPIKWVCGPMLYLLPWVWFWLVMVLVRGLRSFRSLPESSRLLLCLSVVPLAFFLVISGLSRGVLLHWPLVGFLPLYPLFGATAVGLRERFPLGSKLFVASWIVALFALMAFLIVQTRLGLITFPPGAKDPSADICGWQSVATELEARGQLQDPDRFLFTNIWYDSGQLAFAIRGQRQVACFNSYDARGFAFWSEPGDYLHRSAYFVIVDEGKDDQPIKNYGPYFESMALVDEFPMLRGTSPFRKVRIYDCRNLQKPYPFANVRSP